MDTNTYYDRLKLPVDASENQIKSQYRRLAKNCHPDLNPDNPQAAKQFRELHAAYTVLSDSEKRRVYDATILPDSHSNGNANPNGYRYYRKAQTKTQGQVRHRGPRRPMFKPDKPRQAFFSYEVALSIQELFRGARRNLTIAQTHTCPRCRGKGVLGSGEECPRCGGYTFLISYEQVNVIVPPGVLPGTMIRLEVGASYSPIAMFDVLYINEILVTVQVKEGERFTTRDQHLYTSVHVPAAVLEEGGEWTLTAPEGDEPLSLTIPPHSSEGTVITVRRRGLKNGASQRRGNLYCTLVAD